MRARERSGASRLAGAVGIGATGIGGAMALSALAEQNVDANAERDMAAYLATFTCDYGAGRNIRGGEKDVALPGGNELIDLYAEYAALAQSLALRKAALDIPAGIESAVIIDKSDTGLYDNKSDGITNGVYASLARAIMDADGDDAAKMAQIKSDTAQKLKTGAIVAGAGIIASAAIDMIGNRNAPRENSSELMSRRNQLKTRLKQLIAYEIRTCNEIISTGQELAAEIRNDARLMADEDLAEYARVVSQLKPLSDDTDISQLKEHPLCR